MCEKAPSFGQLLRDCVQGSPAHLVFYSDDTTPGNQLRPDTNRQLACCYWTIMELPAWFRARSCGWFPLCMFRTKLMKQIAGGMSFVWRKLLQTFWGPAGGWNFQTVCALVLPHAHPCHPLQPEQTRANGWTGQLRRVLRNLNAPCNILWAAIFPGGDVGKILAPRPHRICENSVVRMRHAWSSFCATGGEPP